MRRGVEDLALTHLLRQFANAPVPTDEATVTTTLNPVWMSAFDTETAAGRASLLAAILRTGTAFVVSDEDAPAFGADLMDVAWEPWDGLPPLPFPRIWIECGSSTLAEPVPFPLVDRDYHDAGKVDWASGHYGMAIMGDEDGWVVLNLMESTRDFVARYPWNDDADVSIEVQRLSPDGSSHYPFPSDFDERQEMDEDPLPAAMSAWQAILLVNVLDVLGARQVELDVPRPHRRAHERQFQQSHPKVYFVDLRQAGDTKAGASDREYQHRWLVRGHWRHLSSGHRTWVRPYVKGPAGAPWRGRPVYIDRT